MNSLSSVLFKAPFTCMLAGPTQSGKTTLLLQILADTQKLISPPPDRIVLCFSRMQNAFLHLPNIELHEGLPDLDQFDPKLNNLLILDDLMSEVESNKSFKNLFTVDSHHKNISVFLVTQNLFSNGKYSRTISLNCHYLVIFNNPRDRAQITFLARQMFPTNQNFLIECYEDATASEHGYLFIDFTQTTKNSLRIQTNILEQDSRIIYQIKK